MTPQRRTALTSVLAAAALVVLKLVTGWASGSLGLISEALHSGTDLVAALLTFFAVGIAGRPADLSHAYGHGKAEHLAALAEASLLVVLSLAVAASAIARLFGESGTEVDAAWWALAVVGVVIVVDASRAIISARASRRYGSAALQANALHFASDLAGSSAVLAGLVLVRAGYPKADAAAALFVGGLVLVAAGRLIRRNIDVLMDHVPAEAEDAARAAIFGLGGVELRRLRMRQAGGRHFADVVIGVSPGAAVGQGHAAADAVEDAVQRALPESDVVVHVEPTRTEGEIRERALAAALEVPEVREIHNVSVLEVDGRTEVSLHLKLPGQVPLERAHAIATDVEHAIVAAAPEIDVVQTHLEPLIEASAGTEVGREHEAISRIVEEATGGPPRELRFLQTEDGLVAFLTLGIEADAALADAHARASEVEELIRRAHPEVADVVVHTEP